MTPVTGKKFTVEELNVNDLTVDRKVQRQGINLAKVDDIIRYFNPAAVGIITVSRRKLAGGQYDFVVIDGMHRVRAVRQLTDNQGSVQCHVFEDLDLAEEAQMFLDLNHTTAPRLLDKFLVQLNAEGDEGDAARDISDMLHAYGWTISHVPANGNVNAVGKLQNIYRLSKRLEAEPNLVHITIMTITRAWGNDRNGVNATILDGLARMYAEYRDRLESDRLIEVMKEYKGGPQTLHAEASQLAAMRKGTVAMAVAELLVEAYNKGRRTKVLENWRKRS